MTAAAFRLPVPEEIPAEEFEKVFPGADEHTRQLFALRELERRMEGLAEHAGPGDRPALKGEVAANAVNDPKWAAFGSAFFDHYSELARFGIGGVARSGTAGNRNL